MTTMTDSQLVRQQSFECDGPVDIDIEVASGSVEVHFANDADPFRPSADTTSTPTSTEADTPTATGTPSDATDAPATPDAHAPDVPSAADTPSVTDTPSDAATGDADSSSGGPAGTTTDHISDGSASTEAGDVDEQAAEHGAGAWRADEQPMIMVEVRAVPRTADQWGLSGLLSWVSSQFGSGQGGRQFAAGQFGNAMHDLAEQAVRETTISVRGNRLSVRAPKSAPLRAVALSIVVHAPAGSSLEATCGSADVQVSGAPDRVNVDTGSGDVSVDGASGQVRVKTGSGDLRLGSMRDGVSARSGSGGIEVSSVTGDGALHTGSGDIWLGSVMGDKVTVRTGSGDLTVADAASGLLQLISGSGDLRIGIRQGVTAEIDITSGSGRTRSDLPVSESPPTGGGTVLHLRARTGSGEAVVGPATA